MTIKTLDAWGNPIEVPAPRPRQLPSRSFMSATQAEVLRLIIKEELGKRVHVRKSLLGENCELVLRLYGPRKEPDYLPDPLFVGKPVRIGSYAEYALWRRLLP